MADKCEAWINGSWKIIDIPTALAYPDISKRCVECHGSVRIHKAGVGVSAHAEHRIAHKGCSLSRWFDGTQRKHPNPAKPSKNMRNVIPQIPEEIISSYDYSEGATTKINVNSYERDPRARKACIKHHGYRCKTCEMSFKETYGPLADKIIHVHHIKPLHKRKKEYKVNPIKDLIPLCPNCHAVIHSKAIPYTLKQIENMIRSSKNIVKEI